MMTTLDIKLSISDEILAHLQHEAEQRNIPLDVVVSETLELYFDEPTDSEILASLQTGMQQALAGNYRPAHDVLDEIEREMSDDADDS
jgi:predicted transcriptional regulator